MNLRALSEMNNYIWTMVNNHAFGNIILGFKNLSTYWIAVGCAITVRNNDILKSY